MPLRRLKPHRVLWISLAALLFYPLYHYALGDDQARLGVEVLLFGASVTISHSWTRGAIDAIKNGASSDWDKGVLTVWGFWTTMMLQRVYAIIFIGMDRPKWLLETPVNGTLTVLFLITAVYAITAPMSGTTAPKEWIQVERKNLFRSIAIGLSASALVVLWLFTRGWTI